MLCHWYVDYVHYTSAYIFWGRSRVGGLFRFIFGLYVLIDFDIFFCFAFLQILLCRSDSGIATCTVSECRWTSPPRFCHLGLAPLFYTKASWPLARLPGHEFGACALGCLLPARACSEPPRQDQTLFVYTLSISLLNLSLISKIL